MIKNQYSIAIYELAKEENSLTDVKDSFLAFMEIYNQDFDFYQVFNSPRIKASEKKDLLKKAFKSLNETFINFLFVIVDNNRESDMKVIYEDFLALLKESSKEKTIRVVSKDELSKDELTKIKMNLEKIYPGYTVEIKNELDEKIIGGYLIYADNKLLDLSLKGKLDNLKASL